MRALVGLSMILLFTAAVLGQGSTPAKYSGYVVDQMCAKKMATKTDVMQKAAGHSKDCALEESCAASGYGIFSDGKYYAFDEKGSNEAKEQIEKSKRSKGMYFEVMGTMSDGILTVASIKEATPPKMAPAKKVEKMEMNGEKKY
jgi:hypothetical protein